VCLLGHMIKIDHGIFCLSRKNEKKQERGILLVGKSLCMAVTCGISGIVEYHNIKIDLVGKWDMN